MTAPYVDSPEELSGVLRELEVALESTGFPDAARRLKEVREGVYTTGSEWLGEVREAVREIRKRDRLPAEIDSNLKRLLGPSYQERVVLRQLWQGIFAGTVLFLLGGAVVALVTADHLSHFALPWTAFVVVILTLLVVSVRRVSVCPACDLRMQRVSWTWCPHCGANITAGTSGSQRRPDPGAVPSPLLACPKCGQPPGGRSRYGTALRSEGQFCTACGALLAS